MRKFIIIKDNTSEFKKELTNSQINLLLPLFENNDNENIDAIDLFNELFPIQISSVISVNILYRK